MNTRISLALFGAMLAAGLVLGVSAWAAEAPKAGEMPEAARRAAIDGRFLLVQGRLDEAVEKLRLALALWPGHAEATDLLAQAEARRTEAQKHYDRAAGLAKESKWDDSLAAVNAAIGVYPAYKQAKDLAADVNRRAAEAFAAEGRGQAAAANLPAAETALRRALDYVPDFAAARDGLARVAAMRADAAAADGRWGAAYLWAAEAAEYAPQTVAYRDQREAARRQVFERIRYAVAPEPDGGAMPSAATSDLRAAAWRRLDETRPEFLALQVAPGAPGLAPATPRQAGPAAFMVRLEAGMPEVRGGLVRTEQRMFRYNVRQEEPNPDYAAVREQLARAQDYLARLRLEYDQPCPFCGGRGWLICRACGGTGFVPGLPPGGPCPFCAAAGGRPGWTRCLRCWGTGRWSRVSLTDLRRAEADVARLQNTLARTPAVIVRQVPADWPYAIEYHERAGALEASLRITDAATGRPVLADSLRKGRRVEDTAIQNANPGIGLAAKTLKLPTDEEMRRAVVDEAAQDAAARIIAATCAARAADRLAEADRLMAEGKVREAAEAGADVAVLKESAARGQGAALMAALRQRLRSHERGEKPAGGPM